MQVSELPDIHCKNEHLWWCVLIYGCKDDYLEGSLMLAVNMLGRSEGHSWKLKDRFALILTIFILKDTIWII